MNLQMKGSTKDSFNLAVASLRTLDLDHFTTLFVVFAIGLGLAILGFFMEVTYSACKANKHSF